MGTLMRINRDTIKFKSIFVCMFTNRYSYISGVFDLFFPLKNSGSALRSIAWTLKETEIDCYIFSDSCFFFQDKTELPIASYLNGRFLMRICFKAVYSRSTCYSQTKQHS